MAPIKDVMRFGKKKKLSLCYVGPLEILDQVNDLSYRVALPLVMSEVHNIFLVSMLKKYILDTSRVLNYESLDLREDLNHEEQPCGNSR